MYNLQVVNSYKKLSDSFLKSGMLDAAYYQPKYDYLFSELGQFKTKAIRGSVRKTVSVDGLMN